MRVGVIQHRVRTHARVDLAAMLAQVDKAVDEDVQVLVFPRMPGLDSDISMLDAFFRNVIERAPALTTVRPRWRYRGEGPLKPFESALGRTLILDGDDCIDPALFPEIQDAGLDALVWLFNPEDVLQAEASLEFAIDASLHLAPVVVISTFTGKARGIEGHGIAAVVFLGEILAEGEGESDQVIVADLPAPGGFPERPRRLPVLAPVLEERLAAHVASGIRTPRQRP